MGDELTVSSREARKSFRSGDHKGKPTSGMCPGHLQANVVVVQEALADDFERFCKRNSAPCQILYRSKPGEVRCPCLCDESDIRTDLSQYCTFKNGKLVDRPFHLLNQDWDGLVTFYLGCSFSFEKALANHGVPVRNIEQKRNVSMFITNVRCQPSGPFNTNLVVSMRPIPRNKIGSAAKATQNASIAHGVPVHIGNPAAIGIEDISKPDFGDPSDFCPGDVPVFWACGVTGIQAAASAKSDVSFTHSPGCMFICDLKSDCSATENSPARISTIDISQSRGPYIASFVSEATAGAVNAMERSLVAGAWRKGVSELSQLSQGSLLRAALSLSHSTNVAITTGFPCVKGYEAPDETDGPPGVLAIARALRKCGKAVSIVLDRKNQFLVNVMKAAMAKFITTEPAEAVPVLVYPPVGEDGALKRTAEDFIQFHKFDHLVSIERAGQNCNGHYLTMSGIDISHLLDPIDELFKAAPDVDVKTICIADGGNELGFGQLREAVAQFVDFGAEIACSVSSDFLIVCGVSNWGGYALAAALYLLRQCPVHVRYLLRGICEEPIPIGGVLIDDMVPSVELEESVLEFFTSAGLRDGVSPEQPMSVDGKGFESHAEKIRQVRDCCLLHACGK
eukprot:m.15291 g.15291  ORF g.15291 m.15291 type:complete len:622 (+) comp26285_c0_seq1:25-1890(+)